MLDITWQDREQASCIRKQTRNGNRVITIRRKKLICAGHIVFITDGQPILQLHPIRDYVGR